MFPQEPLTTCPVFRGFLCAPTVRWAQSVILTPYSFLLAATLVSHSVSSLPPPPPRSPSRPPLPPSPARPPTNPPRHSTAHPEHSPSRVGFTSARDAVLRRSGEAMAAATARAPAADKRYQPLRLFPSYPHSASVLPCGLNRRSPITRV